jgi:hypothetical protein
MSTQLRRVAQAPAHSPARAKYFLAVAALDDGGETAGDDVVYLSATGSFESAMSLADFSTQLAAGATIAANSLLRDLGREVVVYADANPNAHLYKYRQVISVNGPTTEGVGATTGPYVLVWSAAGTNVNVVRTG